MNSSTHDPHLDAAKSEAALQVLGWLGEVGRDTGHFTTALLAAFAAADLSNRKKLERAFPILGHAFVLWKEEGPDALRKWGGVE